MTRRNRNVKIVATLGPASKDQAAITRLHDAGADCFRINMSHTDHTLLGQLVRRIRTVERRSGRPIAILVDLQGPKLRVGRFAEGAVELEEGETFTLDLDDAPGTHARVYLPHKEIFKTVEPGHALLLDDGRIRLQVESSDASAIRTTVVQGGVLKDKKGVNVPDAALPLPALSEKDRADCAKAVEYGADWIALSFVQRPEDVAECRKLVAGRAAVMAKIEKPAALAKLDEIVDLSDGLMVARGDLGVELPIEQVPGWQKRIIRAARARGRPVVVATQMLESMITSPLPTRAEVSDVSTAVFDGADAVMLSAESAAGQYPEEAVAMMNRIAETVEADPSYHGVLASFAAPPEATTADAIMRAAHEVAETLQVASIVCYTQSGSTGLRAARERPNAPVLAFTPVIETARRLTLAWGLHCVTTDDARDIDDMIDRAGRIALEEGFAEPGQRIVITAGHPFGTPGATNLLRIAFVGKPKRLERD